MKLGAIHTPAPAHIPHLAKLIQLPKPPPSFNWHAAADFGTDALGNDRVGDCVPVAALQTLRMLTSTLWGRDAWAPTTDAALALYSANTTPPFDATDPATDLGTDTARFMGYWAATGIRLTDQTMDEIVWTRCEASEARAAIAFCGPVQVSLDLPIAAQDVTTWGRAPGSGPDWAPGSWGAHRVPVGRYDADVLSCITWAQEVALHPDFLARYLLGVDAPVSRLLRDSASLPPEFSWDQAMAAQRAVAA